MGKTNNQNFCYIAHSTFIKKLEEVANQVGIIVIQSEESYTSKASFLDNDYIPTYNDADKTKYCFSGRRTHRGLYKSKNNILINADINGASNIIRKAIPDAFNKVNDFSYL
jgi:putative transposase